MKETIGVVGQGFVGSAVREGMQQYFNVLAYDKDPNKFSNVTGIADIVTQSEVIFVCVPTPMRKSGECDLSILRAAVTEIDTACALEGITRIIVIKSTIPPGTTEQLDAEFHHVHVTFNPEFLTEANAVEDYKNQNRIIIGGDRPYSSRVKRVFEKAFPMVPIIKTSSTIAETIKYVTNTFLTVKVSYANEIYQLCQGLGIDYDKVIEYAKYDTRLGNSHWSVPGPDGDFGYGGHCFRKDISALIYVMNTMNIDSTILDAALTKNEKVRTLRDWEGQKGRAVSDDYND
jgi:UDPglucose 6-dehydrogenase